MSTVMITGGSRGIGAAAVELFAARGDRVYFLYEKDHAAAENVAKKTGATPICCDVADGEAVEKVFAQIGALDILVCNAGIYRGGLIHQLPSADWDRLFDVNVKGIYHCVKAAMPAFLQTHSGCIINISSMWGQVGASCEVPYSSAKAAVIGFTKSLAKELAPSGITVNCICPGVIDTQMNHILDKEVLDQLADETPLGRLGTPEDVCNCAEFLISEKASFITGQILGVNGGYII